MWDVVRPFYIGKIIRPYRKHIYEHNNIGCMKSPIGKPLTLKHHYDTKGITFIVVDKIYDNVRRGDWDHKILQSETKWIYKLWPCKESGLIVSVFSLPYIVPEMLYFQFVIFQFLYCPIFKSVDFPNFRPLD